MKVKDIAFEEELSLFDMSTMHQHFWAFSPTKKVPVLVHGDQTIWDSLAILEYLAELFAEKRLWPENRQQRAHARSIANEMHAGFPGLRNDCPMNMKRTPGVIRLSKEAEIDIRRIEVLWDDCLNRYGGPFLFGEFTNADAMFAPVVNRMEVYQLSDHQAVALYSKAIKKLSAWQEWQLAAKAEPWICENVEL